MEHRKLIDNNHKRSSQGLTLYEEERGKFGPPEPGMWLFDIGRFR